MKLTEERHTGKGAATSCNCCSAGIIITIGVAPVLAFRQKMLGGVFMFSLTRLVKVGYLLAFALVVCLLLSAKPSQAQSHVWSGYRSAPGMNITIPIITGSSGFGGGFSGGFAGFGGTFGGGFGGGSFNLQTATFTFPSFLPGPMPPPTMNLPLNNFGPAASLYGFVGFPPFLGFPSYSDSTGAPWALITALGLFNPGGGFGGFGGGFGGFGGGFGLGGFGVGGVGGFGVGGVGGFAGKGFGGFNGGKPL
jgi:hypothetical protein